MIQKLFLITVLTFAVGCKSTSTLGPNEIKISHQSFKGAWPFTIEKGVLSCRVPNKIVFEADGKSYAVNGLAMSDPTLLDMKPIWQDDAEHVLKVSAGDIIIEGQKLCGK